MKKKSMFLNIYTPVPEYIFTCEYQCQTSCCVVRADIHDVFHFMSLLFVSRYKYMCFIDKETTSLDGSRRLGCPFASPEKGDIRQSRQQLAAVHVKARAENHGKRRTASIENPCSNGGSGSSPSSSNFCSPWRCCWSWRQRGC
jgi:hypothetical protein